MKSIDIRVISLKSRSRRVPGRTALVGVKLQRQLAVRFLGLDTELKRPVNDGEATGEEVDYTMLYRNSTVSLPSEWL